MTAREQSVVTVLLDVLAEWSEPLDEAVSHAQMNLEIPGSVITLAEFRHAVKTAGNEGWIQSIETKRRGALWAITNKGRAERTA